MNKDFIIIIIIIIIIKPTPLAWNIGGRTF